MSTPPVPVFFNNAQLDFKPLYEWAFGERIEHPETTARAESILTALQAEPAAFELRDPDEIPKGVLREVHSANLLTLYQTARQLPEGKTFYPTVFPKRDQNQGDPKNIMHAGCYCFDAGTPLDAQTWSAATWSAACARQAAVALQTGDYPLTYALSRPPGHHATRTLFGGYCYFNNAAIAAKHFRKSGARVAVLDIDFHHGNGTQSIFYEDNQVLFVDIHGDPREFFPFFAGFPEEAGRREGIGFTVNLPQPGGFDGQAYAQLLEQRVLPLLANFAPDVLVLSAGLDTYEKDPIGRFGLKTADFHTIGELIGRARYPTVVVQEGGYYTPDLGVNARSLLHGLRDGVATPRRSIG